MIEDGLFPCLAEKKIILWFKIISAEESDGEMSFTAAAAE